MCFSVNLLSPGFLIDSSLRNVVKYKSLISNGCYLESFFFLLHKRKLWEKVPNAEKSCFLLNPCEKYVAECQKDLARGAWVA